MVERLQHWHRQVGRRIGWLLLTLFTSLTVLLLQHEGALQRAEWIAYDARLNAHRSGSELHPDIAVVLIDEHSLDQMNDLVGRWPWPRSVFAGLIDYFAMGGAEAVVFDILFSEHQTNGDGDAQFAEMTAQAGNVWHAIQLFKDVPDRNGERLTPRPLPEGFQRLAIQGAEGFHDGVENRYEIPIEEYYQATAGVGVVSLESDPDSVYRRSQLVHTYLGHSYPSLSLGPVLARLKPQHIVREDDAILLDDLRIPLDAKGNYRVNMVGHFDAWSIGGIIASYAALMQGDQEPQTYPDVFAGKIVFIGASAVGLEDVKTTPVSTRTPGVYIHASVASNLLNENLLQPAPVWHRPLLVVLFALLVSSALLTSSRTLVQHATPLVCLFGYLLLGWYAFLGQGLILDMTAPLLAIVVSWLTGSAWLAITEGRERRRVRTMFGQYVSPAMLEQLSGSGLDHLTAEVGTTEELTILFSDVRGFTTLSESLPAEQVVDLLNIHLHTMVEIIFQYDGTLDKYIGDAIMAFWGAPIPVDNHADLAVQSAIVMDREMATVNRLLAEKNYPPIAIGIGLNTGPMVLGNIGSEKKLDYTVIGDNVNLGSRLEGLTKPYGCPIVISEYTYHALASDIPCQVVDLVRVKGKKVPIRVYCPLALPDDPETQQQAAREQAALTEAAFNAYLAQHWDTAIECYRRIANQKLAEVFIKRCTTYQRQPPPSDWDGVFTMTSK